MSTSNSATLIVDADGKSRAALSKLLLRGGFEAVQASTGEQALATARSQRPWLVLLNVCLPDVSGFEVCRELRDEFSEELSIIFLSGERTEPLDRVAGFLVGGDDYIIEPFDPGELLARIRRFNERRRIDGNGGHTSNRGEEHAQLTKLTQRELEVLRLLALGSRTREIASTLKISEKTVASHLQRVLTKLGVNTRAQAVGSLYRSGLLEMNAPGAPSRPVTPAALEEIAS